jgi:phage terminase small subunit
MRKPRSVASDERLSEIWDGLVSAGAYDDSQGPALAMLCTWLAIAEKAVDELVAEGMSTSLVTDQGEERERPQMSTLKKASAEIRALQKQLGAAQPAPQKKEAEVTPLALIQSRRKKRAAGAED